MEEIFYRIEKARPNTATPDVRKAANGDLRGLGFLVRGDLLL
jgi:hypothetical protein